MRKEKLDELNNYIEELKVKKLKLLDANGKFLSSQRYLVELNNGHIMTREKIVKNGRDGNAVIVLPINDENNTILVVQPRVFTKSGIGIELPAGYVDDNESYEAAARRELFEETGYIPKNMVLLNSFYQDQGCSAAYNQSFLAMGCERVGKQHLDGDEFIRYFECSYDEMLELIDMGMINDCQSLLTIERSKQYIKNSCVLR